jgi:opacity protein-like surface antigen
MKRSITILVFVLSFAINSFGYDYGYYGYMPVGNVECMGVYPDARCNNLNKKKEKKGYGDIYDNDLYITPRVGVGFSGSADLPVHLAIGGYITQELRVEIDVSTSTIKNKLDDNGTDLKTGHRAFTTNILYNFYRDCNRDFQVITGFGFGVSNNSSGDRTSRGRAYRGMLGIEYKMSNRTIFEALYSYSHYGTVQGATNTITYLSHDILFGIRFLL